MSAELLLTDQSPHRPLQGAKCHVTQVPVGSQIVPWLKLTCAYLAGEELHATESEKVLQPKDGLFSYLTVRPSLILE